MQCEIFQTILDEATESYKPEIVFELQSNSPEDMEVNLGRIKAWVNNWKTEKNIDSNNNCTDWMDLNKSDLEYVFEIFS